LRVVPKGKVVVQNTGPAAQSSATSQQPGEGRGL
jgi:hypothetical protein